MAKSKNTSSKKSTAKTFEEVYTNGKNGFETAAKNFENLFNVKGLEEVTELSKQNLDAVAESTTLLAQGCQEINSALLGFAQNSMQTGLNACKSLMDCKSMQDALDLHTAYARDFFEGMVSEGTRISELSVRVANEAFEPVRDRVNATVEKMLKNAA